MKDDFLDFIHNDVINKIGVYGEKTIDYVSTREGDIESKQQVRLQEQ